MTLDHYLAFRLPASYAVGDFALGIWNDHWLMSHEAVRCRFCLAAQKPSNANEPLQHCPGCDISEEHYPLRDLAKILAALPTALA